MGEDRSTYITELVCESTQFAAGTKKAVAELQKVGAAADKLDRSRLNSLKAQEAAEQRMKRFNRLSDTQKLVVLEEKRLRLASLVARAEERGAHARAATLRAGIAGIDARASMVGVNSDRSGSKSGGPSIVTAGLKGAGLGQVGSMGALGIVYAIVRTIVSLFTDALEASAATKKQVASAKEALKVSEGATEALAGIAGGFAVLIAGIKKGLAELIGIPLNLAQGAVGMFEEIAGAGLKKLGLKTLGQSLQDRGSATVAESIANRSKALGGLGGSGQSELAVKEEALKKAQAERAKERQSESLTRLKAEESGITSMFGGMAKNSGGSAGMYAVAGGQAMNAKLVTIQSQMLAEIRSQIRAVKAVETAVKENGV